MKIIEDIKKDKTELQALKQFEKKKVLVDTRVLRPGHKCFEINHDTLACVEAQYEREVHFNEPDTRKVMIKQGCSYINALNKENALKVFKKGGRIQKLPLMNIKDLPGRDD